MPLTLTNDQIREVRAMLGQGRYDDVAPVIDYLAHHHRIQEEHAANQRRVAEQKREEDHVNDIVQRRLDELTMAERRAALEPKGAPTPAAPPPPDAATPAAGPMPAAGPWAVT